MANAALYLSKSRYGSTARILGGRSDERFFRNPTFLEWKIESEEVRLNVMPRDEIAEHLSSFCRWIERLREPDDRKIEAKRLISRTKSVLGLVTSLEFGESNPLWRNLVFIAKRHDGIIFAYDSIWLADGSVLLGSFRPSQNA